MILRLFVFVFVVTLIFRTKSKVWSLPENINIALGEGNGGNEDNTVENLLIEAIDNVLGGRSGRNENELS